MRSQDRSGLNLFRKQYVHSSKASVELNSKGRLLCARTGFIYDEAHINI